MYIHFITTGGTIDKVYFDDKSQFEVGTPQIASLLRDANVTLDLSVESLMHKDSLHLTDADRELIRQHVAAAKSPRIIVTHGTDTMTQTALALRDIPDKTIVLVGSMQPALFRNSDALFNIGVAIGAVQTLPPGVYIAMNGQIFDPAKSRKNREKNCFERIEDA